jgi:hypothetical protein
MSNNNREQLTAELTAKLLDAALGQYRSVEPRAGLEERILANLQTERQAARWFWWQWGPILASAAVIMILFATLSLTNQAVRPALESTRVAAVVTTNGPTPSREVQPLAQVSQSGAEAAVAVVRRMSRKLRVMEASAPHLIAQQTRPLASGDLRIEDVKIPAVSLAEITIR